MNMELVQTIEVGSNVTSVEFTSIPDDGSDLQILIAARDTGQNATMSMTFNNITTAYRGQRLRGNDSIVESFFWSSTSAMFFDFPSSDAGTSNRGSAEVYIANPSRTSPSPFGQKIVSINTITEQDGSISYQGTYSWSARDSSLQSQPVTSIKFTTNIFAGATFNLYKITAA